LPKKNLCPLFSLLCLLLLGDEIAQKEADCYRAKKDWKLIGFQIRFPTADFARHFILMSIGLVISGRDIFSR